MAPRRAAGAGLRADPRAGRRRHPDRRRADGGGARDHARLRHARPHDADRLDPPGARHDREDRAGRRARRRRGRCSSRRARAAHGSSPRPGGRGGRGGQRDLGQPLRRAGRLGALPFPRELYEETIRASGRGVEASLAAFAAGFEGADGSRGAGEPGRRTRPCRHRRARAGPGPAPPRPSRRAPRRRCRAGATSTARVDALPEPVRAMARAGLARWSTSRTCATARNISTGWARRWPSTTRRTAGRLSPRGGEVSRQRDGLRRRDPRRRPQDRGPAARRACAASWASGRRRSCWSPSTSTRAPRRSAA